MRRFGIMSLAMAVLLVVLVLAATVGSGNVIRSSTPEQAVRTFYEQVRGRDWAGAARMVSASSNTDWKVLSREIGGSDGSLRTYASLQKVDTKVLRSTDSEATVRADITWSTAVGAFYESRDLDLVRESGDWRIRWQKSNEQKTPPQVIPVNYLRWDIVRAGGEEDWGAQNVEAPRVRIVSMNAVERDGNVIIMGEIVNEDTVPALVSVNATLVGKDGKDIATESSFDKIQHTLLPKEVSPFRVDFPKQRLGDVKNVRMQPNALLVPASADPTIAVLNQRVEKDARGRSVLRGDLVNQSGQVVNIPHVLATFYDNAGRVIWVSDGYVDKALQPQQPIGFALDLREDVAANVHNSRLTVNHFSLESL